VDSNGERRRREQEREQAGAKKDEGSMTHVSSFLEGNGRDERQVF
jgi:hypothetical protein